MRSAVMLAVERRTALRLALVPASVTTASRTPLFGEKMQTPDYSKLTCPKCGEKKEFKEIALTETSQPFTILQNRKDGEGDSTDLSLDWQITGILDEPTYAVLEIRCGKCDEIVWEGNKEQTLDYD